MFSAPDFTISTITANIAYVNVREISSQLVFSEHDAAVNALATHPKEYVSTNALCAYLRSYTLCTYNHTCIHVHTYIRTYVHTYIHVYMLYVGTYVCEHA